MNTFRRTRASQAANAEAELVDAESVGAQPRKGSRLLTALVVLFGIAVFGLGVGARVADLHFNTVLSNSMQPTFSAGDLAVTQVVDVSSIAVGDVIAFTPPGDKGPVIHRVASLVDGVITTRGDANPSDDPWRLTPTSPSAYRLVAVIPFAGWLSQLQVPALVLAGVLAGLAALQTLWKEVMRRLAHQPLTES